MSETNFSLQANGPIIFTGLFLLFLIIIGKWYIVKTHFSYLKILNLFIAGVAVIMIWRSIVGLIDLYLYPWDKETSYWMGLIMGLSLVSIFVFEFRIR